MGQIENSLVDLNHLKIKAAEYFFGILFISSFVFIGAYIWDDRINLIPWMVIPVSIPYGLLFYKVRSTKNYSWVLIGLAFFMVSMPLLKFVTEPLYLIDAFIIIMMSSFAFSLLKRKHALVLVLIHVGIYYFAALIVYFYKPFNIIYTSDNLASILIGSLVCLFAAIFISYSFSKKNEEMIDELKHTSEKLSRSNNDQSFLMNVIIHDVNNSLMKILMRTDLFGVKKELDRDEDFIKLKNQIGELDILMKNLIAMRNLSDLDPEKVIRLIPVSDIFYKIDLIFRSRAEMKKIHLDFYQMNADEKIEVEPVSFVYQILNNLVDNAIKFAQPETVVRICFVSNDDQQVFQIENHCSSVHRENIEKLTSNQKLESIDGSLKERGSGIGHTIVQEFCEIFGYKHSVEFIAREDDLHVKNCIKIK